jgi:very-short-patch-repair endonuclease
MAAPPTPAPQLPPAIEHYLGTDKKKKAGKLAVIVAQRHGWFCFDWTEHNGTMQYHAVRLQVDEALGWLVHSTDLVVALGYQTGQLGNWLRTHEKRLKPHLKAASWSTLQVGINRMKGGHAEGCTVAALRQVLNLAMSSTPTERVARLRLQLAAALSLQPDELLLRNDDTSLAYQVVGHAMRDAIELVTAPCWPSRREAIFGTYRIDLYYDQQRVGVECDEHNHADRSPQYEHAREAYLHELGITLVRFDPHAADFNLHRVLGTLVKLLHGGLAPPAPPTTSAAAK